MRVKDLPEQDRPRERLLARGAEALSDRELLALLLGSGTCGCDAVELAGRLIAKYGSLHELSRTDAHELAADLPGMGPAKAARVVAAFQLGRRSVQQTEGERRRISGSADLAAVTAPMLRGLRTERVVVVICDGAGVIIRVATLTDGARDRSLVPVRDVLALVLAAGGASFGLAHNHPTGRVEASAADRLVTTRLNTAAETVGLRFLDHIVLTDNAWKRIESQSLSLNAASSKAECNVPTVET